MTIANQIVESQTLTASAVGASSHTFSNVSVLQDDGAGNTGRYQLHAFVIVSSASAGVAISRVDYGVERLAPDHQDSEAAHATTAGRPAVRTFSAGEWPTGANGLTVEVTGGNIDSIVVFLCVMPEVAEGCIPPFGPTPRTDPFNRLGINPIWEPSQGNASQSTFGMIFDGSEHAFELSNGVNTEADIHTPGNEPASCQQPYDGADFDFYVRKNEGSGFSNNSRAFAGVIAQDRVTDNDWIFGSHYDTNRFYYRSNDGGTITSYLNGPADPLAQTAHLRLTKAGSDYDFRTSDDASTWVDATTTQTATLSTTHLGFSCGIYNTGSSVGDNRFFEFVNLDNPARELETPEHALEFLTDEASAVTSIDLAFSEATDQGAALCDIAVIAASDAVGTMSEGSGDELLAEGVVSSTDGIRYAIVAAQVDVSGSTAGTTVGATWSGAADAAIAGLQFRIDELVQAGVTGTGTLDLGALSLTGSGQVTATVSGSGTLDLGALNITGSGEVGAGEVTGSGTLDLGELSLTGSGVITAPVTGSGVLDLGDYSVTGAGLVTDPVTGSGTLNLGILELAGSGQVTAPVSGSGSLDLGALEIIGSGVVGATIVGTGILDLGPTEIAGSGVVEPIVSGSGSLDLGALGIVGSGVVSQGVTGTGVLDLGPLGITGQGFTQAIITGAGALELGALSISGSGLVTDPVFGSGQLDLGALELTGSGQVTAPVTGSGVLDLGELNLVGVGVASGALLGSGTLDLGPLGITGSGQVNNGPVGAGALDLGVLSISGSGTVDNGITGSGSLDLGDLEVSGVGQVTATVSGQATALDLGVLSIVGFGVVGDRPSVPLSGRRGVEVAISGCYGIPVSIAGRRP